MLEFIKGILSGESGLPAQIVSVMIATNIALSGIKAALDSIKDKTTNTIDDSASNVIGKITGIFGWVVDVLSANKEHK